MKTSDDQGATGVWNERYSDADAACARPPDGTDPIDYTQHEFLSKNLVYRPLTGIPSLESYDFLKRTVFSGLPSKKVLAVGCGLAFAEQALIEKKIVDHIEAYELSDVAVESARQRLKAAGLEDKLVMHAGDVMTAGLKDNSFDAVYVSAAIHHFFNLEEMMDLFHRVLKVGGMLVYDEYVGPDHHMYDDNVMSILDRINDCLDSRYRKDELRGGEPRSSVPRATLEWMMDMDPSEGVHASMILPLTYQKFEVVHRFDYGGTLMRPFWVGILNNFDFNDAKDQTIARLIGLIESLLVEKDVIPTYHTVVAARKTKDSRPGPLKSNDELAKASYTADDDRLIKSVFREKNVFSCIDLTDSNWKNGVLKYGPQRFLVTETPTAKATFKIGNFIILEDGKSATILDVVNENDLLVVTWGASSLERHELEAPTHFWVSSFKDMAR